MKNRTAVVAGSFDPITRGHTDIVERAAALFDDVVVAILGNPAKPGRLPYDMRSELARVAVGHLPRVRVAAHPGELAVHVCHSYGAVALVKGVRGSSDVEHEAPMATFNRQVAGVETVLLPARSEVAHISSTLVWQLGVAGVDISAYVCEEVAQAIAEAAR